MTENRKRCVYTRLDNGIHEFVFHEASRATVDEMIDHVREILASTPDDAPRTCYLADNSRVEAIPLIYLRSRIKELDAQRPVGREPGRLAILYEGRMGSMANTILSFALKNTLRFFRPDERNAAMAWLLQD